MKSERESDVFKTSPAEYMKQVIRQKLLWLTVMSAAIAATAFILSFHDLKWAFVGLIFIFLIVPMMMFNAYFFYLLTPEAVRAVGMKSVTILDNGNLLIRYFKRNDDGEIEFSGNSETIVKENIKRIDSGDKNIMIYLVSSRPGFIIIPKDALDTETINHLYSNEKQNQVYN